MRGVREVRLPYSKFLRAKNPFCVGCEKTTEKRGRFEIRSLSLLSWRSLHELN